MKKITLSIYLTFIICLNNSIYAQDINFELLNQSKKTFYIFDMPYENLSSLPKKLSEFKEVKPQEKVQKNIDLSKSTTLFIFEKKPTETKQFPVYVFKPNKKIYVSILTTGKLVPQKRILGYRRGYITQSDITREIIQFISAPQPSELTPEPTQVVKNLNTVLNQLKVSTIDQAVNKIKEFNALLEDLEAKTVEQAQQNLDQLQKNIEQKFERHAKMFKVIFQTNANAVGSDEFNKKIDQTPLEDFIEGETIQRFTQLSFDLIFELKKRYFESVKLLQEFTNPLIGVLQDLVKAKQQKASREALLRLIPEEIPKPPSIEAMSREELINALKQIKIELG